MMSITQFLLNQLSEEGKEVGGRCSKAMRFGLDEIEPNQKDGATLNNRERIEGEVEDLMVVLTMLRQLGMVHDVNTVDRAAIRLEKRRKVLRYYQYSVRLGQVEGGLEEALAAAAVDE